MLPWQYEVELGKNHDTTLSCLGKAEIIIVVHHLQISVDGFPFMFMLISYGEFNEVGRCLLFEMICLARLPVIYKDSFILRSFVFAYASLLKLFDSENNCTFIYILK